MALLKTITINLVILVTSFFVVSLLLNIDAALDLGDFRFLAATIIGWSFIVAGLTLRFWASSIFYESGAAVLQHGQQNKLITTGPYAKTRNPLHLGAALVVLGSAVALGSYIGTVAAILLFMFFDLRIRDSEEKDLERIFGSVYLEYKNSVPRWWWF